MSKQRRCKICDRDLYTNPDNESMGGLECCCNRGYCMDCCKGDKE